MTEPQRLLLSRKARASSGRQLAGQRFQLRGVELSPEFLPTTVRDLHGTVTIEDGIARRREIVLGPVRAGFAEVAKGIEPGETVVIKGVTRVVDGSKVQVVPVESARASSPERTTEP